MCRSEEKPQPKSYEQSGKTRHIGPLPKVRNQVKMKRTATRSIQGRPMTPKTMAFALVTTLFGWMLCLAAVFFFFSRVVGMLTAEHDS